LKINRLLAGTLGLVLITGLVSPAFAASVESDILGISTGDPFVPSVAPDHTEVGDAGSLPATAQIPGGSGPLNSIEGSLGSSDQEDVYEICITDHNAFSAAGAAQFDPQLFLFAQNGLGVYSNDDKDAADGSSFLPSGDPNSPAADGIYYLGITAFDNEPINVNGLIFPTQQFFPGSSVISGPTGPGGASAVSGWQFQFGSQPSVGLYTIDLTGVASTAAACTPVGGELIPIDSTSLLLAGAQSFSWMIPVVLSGIGIGLFVVFRKSE